MARDTQSSLLPGDVSGKTVIVTGGANGIGAQTIRRFCSHGANVVIADLPLAQKAADELIATLPASRAIFVPVNILVWKDMVSLFKKTIERFGQVDIVVANAGMMESHEFYDLATDANGDLEEPLEAHRVVDVNLKGTMNTVRLAMHHMRSNKLNPGSKYRGSILLIASTSGYFGGTGVVSYIASKHGVVGLLRSSQKAANNFGIKEAMHKKWRERGLPANTVEDVASAVMRMATDDNSAGHCLMVAGKKDREVEATRTALMPTWIGSDIANLMAEGGRFFNELGGYPLPKPRI